MTYGRNEPKRGIRAVCLINGRLGKERGRVEWEDDIDGEDEEGWDAVVGGRLENFTARFGQDAKKY
jgi:hypothetical protein